MSPSVTMFCSRWSFLFQGRVRSVSFKVDPTDFCSVCSCLHFLTTRQSPSEPDLATHNCVLVTEVRGWEVDELVSRCFAAGGGSQPGFLFDRRVRCVSFKVNPTDFCSALVVEGGLGFGLGPGPENSSATFRRGSAF